MSWGLSGVPFNSAWEAKFAELQRYRDDNGHCNVSRWGDNPQLGSWDFSEANVARRAPSDSPG